MNQECKELYTYTVFLENSRVKIKSTSYFVDHGILYFATEQDGKLMGNITAIFHSWLYVLKHEKMNDEL